MKALAISSLLLVACGGDMHPMLSDAGCGAPGVAPDQPQIACPAMVDLGCVPASGSTLTYEIATGSCSGATPELTCTPPSGSTIQPGGATSVSCVARAASGAEVSCSFPVRSQVAGAPMLTCTPRVMGSCTGALSTVNVPQAVGMGSCSGATVGAITSDAPAGFPVGETTVTSSATTSEGSALQCTTIVAIADDAPPQVECPSAPPPIIRLAPTDPIAVPPPTATDACDPSVDVMLAPLPAGRGHATITATATDDAGMTGTCTFAIDVLDVFAAEHFRVLSAELTASGATDVTLAWDDPAASVDTTDYRLERATDPAGPFTALITMPVGTSTYTDAAIPASRVYYRLVSVAGATDGGITPVVRALAIAQDSYEIPSQTVPSVPFPTTLYGVIRRPVDAGGASPLVVFLHGNHGNCRPATGDDDCLDITEYACTSPGYTTTPNAEGYLYLMDSLAAQGFFAVSISANALNCRDDFIPERVQLLLEHLRRFAAWAGTDDPPFAGRLRGLVDPSRTSLFGHSRGGEAVSLAPQALRDTPIAGVALRSVFAVGPTDYHDPVPSGVPYAVLLPGCDADVRTLEGLHMYDRGLNPSDPHARAQVLYIGANHNFFNTAWRFDDNLNMAVCALTDEVGGAAQRAMLEGVLGDWLHATMSGEPLPPYVRAEAGSPQSLDAWAGLALDLRWSYSAASRTAIDTFDEADAPAHNLLGGANSFIGYTATLDCTGTCSSNFTHLVNGVRLAWQTATATSSWPLAGFDASAYDVVSFRFASRIATINNGVTEHDFAIRVRDAAGGSAQVHLADFGRLAHRYPSRAEQEVLTTVRVPFSALTGVDRAHLSAIELEMPVAGGNPQGSIWVADVDLASD